MPPALAVLDQRVVAAIEKLENIGSSQVDLLTKMLDKLDSLLEEQKQANETLSELELIDTIPVVSSPTEVDHSVPRKQLAYLEQIYSQNNQIVSYLDDFSYIEQTKGIHVRNPVTQPVQFLSPQNVTVDNTSSDPMPVYFKDPQMVSLTSTPDKPLPISGLVSVANDSSKPLYVDGITLSQVELVNYQSEYLEQTMYNTGNLVQNNNLLSTMLERNDSYYTTMINNSHAIELNTLNTQMNTYNISVDTGVVASKISHVDTELTYVADQWSTFMKYWSKMIYRPKISSYPYQVATLVVGCSGISPYFKGPPKAVERWVPVDEDDVDDTDST